LAPEIFGHEDVKKALLLLLVGAPHRKLKDGMQVRRYGGALCCQNNLMKIQFIGIPILLIILQLLSFFIKCFVDLFFSGLLFHSSAFSSFNFSYSKFGCR